MAIWNINRLSVNGINLHNTKKSIIEDLIVKYLRQTLSKAEKTELDNWINASKANKKLFEELTDSQLLMEELKSIHAIDDKKAWRKIAAFNLQEQSKTFVKVPKRRLWLQLGIAASIIAGLFVISYFLMPALWVRQAKPLVVVHTTKDVKAPEKNRAVITLYNGKVVYLDSLPDGGKVAQEGVSIIKKADGQLAYKADSSSQALVYNTLFNPRGSKTLTLVLSDGTKVWLNSETTFRYPVNFVGNERKVEIIGEAYFEVAKMPSKPFKVASGTMEAEVLGTHFNINAYPDEDAIETTLLEGKVKVKNGTINVDITPGQQARFSEKTPGVFKIERNVDVNNVMAWKKGLFEFDNAGLPVIMRQIGRWYNRDIVFKEKHDEEEYGGGIARKVPLSDVLQMLEEYGVKFKVDEKKITVMP